MPFFYGVNPNITGGIFNDMKGDQNNYYFTAADSENGTDATVSVNTLLIFAVKSSRDPAP